MPSLEEILSHQNFSKEEIKVLLAAEGEDKKRLFDRALQVKLKHLDNHVHLRGLIEYSNICTKYCLYCGVRCKNLKVERYQLSDEEVIECAQLAHKLGYGSVALQSGERSDKAFVDKITHLVKEIKKIDNGSLGITLSLGEQTEETYRRWFEAGAHRYLLRIEASNEDLYYKIHPRDEKHDFKKRLACIDSLLKVGYQTGTGVMVGLPFQTLDDLAGDLLFFQQKDVAMVGMGPYNPHPETPLTLSGAPYPSAERRLALGLKMIALLRLLVPDINIAAATALEVLDPRGREKGILSGANVIMPNITPEEQMVKYNLYDRKTLLRDCPSSVDPEKRDTHICRNCVFPFCSLGDDLNGKKIVIGYGRWGDSKHFKKP